VQHRPPAHHAPAPFHNDTTIERELQPAVCGQGSLSRMA
jgi:hypothetical protein